MHRIVHQIATAATIVITVTILIIPQIGRKWTRN